MYFYTRRAISENAAKWALIFGCFWYEFLIFAPHALAESYAAAFFMCALAIGYGTNNIARLLLGGLLLGLTFAMRVPYAPLVAVYGITWLVILPRRLWAYPLGGGAVGLLIWGAVDYWTWGGFWASLINYLIIAPKDAVQFPFWILYADAARVSFGIYAFVLLYAIWHWRKHWRLLAMLATIPAAINYYNREYSNLFIVLPLLWILIAATLNDRRQPSATAKKRRHKKHAKLSPNNRLLKPAIGFIAVISLLGIFNKIPFTPPNIFGHGTNQHPFLFMLTPQYAITQAVRDSLGAETPRAVRWDAAHDALAMGGYYQLHIKTPLYFAGDFRHQQLIKDNGGAAQKLFTHIVDINTYYNSPWTRLSPVLVRNNLSATPPPNYVYDIIGNYYVNHLLKQADKSGKELPPSELTPF